MFRIVVLAIAMLLIGAALALSESSEGIRIVSARDLLNYAEMPTFRDAVLDRIKHTENGVSWGMLVSKKDLYCTPHSLPLAPEQILTIMGRYTKDNSTELDRNWELVMINALKNVFPCVDLGTHRFATSPPWTCSLPRPLASTCSGLSDLKAVLEQLAVLNLVRQSVSGMC